MRLNKFIKEFGSFKAKADFKDFFFYYSIEACFRGRTSQEQDKEQISLWRDCLFHAEGKKAPTR